MQTNSTRISRATCRPAKQCYFLRRRLEWEKTLNSSPGWAQIERRIKFGNLWAVYVLWRTLQTVYTGCLQKNGTVSKVNKKFISHLTRAKRTPLAAATVQVSHALPAVRFSCLLRGLRGFSQFFECVKKLRQIHSVRLETIQISMTSHSIYLDIFFFDKSGTYHTADWYFVLSIIWQNWHFGLMLMLKGCDYVLCIQGVSRL